MKSAPGKEKVHYGGIPEGLGKHGGFTIHSAQYWCLPQLKAAALQGLLLPMRKLVHYNTDRSRKQHIFGVFFYENSEIAICSAGPIDIVNCFSLQAV